MRALFDVNMLLALCDPSHLFHSRARRWWTENEYFGWASCPLTENGFLRIASQRGYPRPRRLSDALTLLRGWTKLPPHEFWPDDVSMLDADQFDHSRLLGPKQITDVYLLALATRNRGRLVTLDHGIPIAAVRGATAESLVVVR